ncbi:ImmA/IrrE family metallo-endopeptidase [Peptostreptococcaceae bacterium AGR-M142]
MYEKLLNECYNNNVDVYEVDSNIKGLYYEDTIFINKSLKTKEKTTILAEELGHHYTLCKGNNILNQSKIENIKNENKGRNWAYQKLISLEKIIECYEKGIYTIYELSNELGLDQEFFLDAIDYFSRKYGTHIEVDNYIINFNPLYVVKNLY